MEMECCVVYSVSHEHERTNCLSRVKIPPVGIIHRGLPSVFIIIK